MAEVFRMVTTLEIISTDRAPTPGGHYSQAIVCGEQIFISGQLPIAPNGAHDASADFEAQARRALSNLLAVLDAAGGTASGLAKVTVYIVGIEHWPAFNRIYAEMLGPIRPARSVVPVPLLHYGYLVEIDAIAVRTTDDRIPGV